MPDNRVKSVVDYFHLQLDALYPRQEVDSFAFLSFNHYKGFTRTDLTMKDDERLSESELLSFIRVAKKLKQFEPIQYILGETEFYGLNFRVNKAVLIPRPETEELVDWILKSHKGQGFHVLDIGTGSGCIPISLKKNLNQAQVSAVDISPEALEVAKKNAQLNEGDVEFYQLDIRDEQVWQKLGQYDIIVSNPPYVLESEKAEMEKNVLDYEPELALFVKENDPLVFYRYILKFAQSHLKPDGNIYFELNEKLGQSLIALCNDLGFANCELRQDLRNKDRMLRCSR